MKADVLKNKAEALRRKGYSFREISEKLGISKSTASLWLRDVKLDIYARKRIENLGINGREKASSTNKKKRLDLDAVILEKVKLHLKNQLRIDSKQACALLYWCEGTKHSSNSAVSFTNADPEMIKYFLHVFRKAFELDEKKFRGLMHLHEYHNEERQMEYWSKITSIPKTQFNKSFLKKNTGKNKKENYPGCLNLRYFDVKIYKEIMFLIKEIIKM